ncbi:hypothetical protein L218DRAFT_1003413 [Marasmius fiardii PR-910]|nr:hypothetical protein L218DRAFT_1003413 [Marasmius fiardii PR-910]
MHSWHAPYDQSGPYDGDNSDNDDDKLSAGNSNGGAGGPPGPLDGNPSDGEDPNSEDDEICLSISRSGRRLNNTPAPVPPVLTAPVFNQTRYSSVDTTFSTTEQYVYDPTPQSEEAILLSTFRTFEDLIRRRLFGPASSTPNNAQKTVIQNIPKPPFYR